ncbi:MAG: hypothetical protein JWR09_3604 [Mucilaginibacter sp.]|nr:hypothetical protein [Mucilaginibacter sp.]
MRILQTFWTGPSNTNNENLVSMKAGWLSCEYHWMSWALSCLQAKAIFGEVNLVTDLKGKEILIDRLQLPYSSGSTELEGTLDHYHPALWALAKIYTYSIQTEPFLHLDGDVFIWQKPDEEFLGLRLAAQNLDKNLEFYLSALNGVNEHFTYIPPSLLKENYEHKDLYGSNAGLLGGSDLNFFKNYCEQAFKFIDENKASLTKVNTGSLNFIFEQYLFCQLAAAAKIPISYYGEMVDNPVFKDYIKFEDYPHIQMIHPVGGFKKYPHVCDHVAKKLRSDYPEYYYRVINMVRSGGANMRSAIYISPLLKLDQLPSLAAEKPGAAKKAEPLFDRTNAAIDYLNKKHSVSDLKPNISRNEFIKQAKLLLPHNPERDCLLEIFRLESTTNSLLKKLYANQPVVTSLYKAGIKTYERIQEIFSLPENELLKIKIGLPEHYKLLTIGWNWKLDYKEQVHALIERNFTEEKLSRPVLLLPDELQGNIKEYYLDELDMIIFDTIKEPFTIGDILPEMKQYFSSEEIEENYLAFKQLIINTIKGMLYAGSVKINS